MKFIIAATAIAALLGPASAHSWVEELQVIDSATGKYTGDYGYPRGYVARTDPGFNGDSMNYLLPPLSSGRTRIDGADLLCHPNQRSSNYANSAYPRLRASPGSYVAMKYLENGHVTLPQNQPGKPQSGGPVFVYGTTKPSDTEKIADVLKWNAQGNGGDKRGTLLAAQSYDDGRCHQINSGTISTQRQKSFPDRVADQPTSSVEQWCETDLHIPTTQKAGDILTVYWVWSWPTTPGAEAVYPSGKDEYYTSCAEIEIVDSIGQSKAVHSLVQQDPQTAAVSDFKSRTAFTSSPVFTLADAASASASGPASSMPATSSAVATSSVAALPSSVAYSPSSSVAYTPSSATPPAMSSSSTSRSANSELSTDLPTITLPSSGMPSSGPTTKPSNANPPFPSKPSANPNGPFQSGNLPSIVTVTKYTTMPSAANKQHEQTRTKTEFVTSYVTAAPSTVVATAAALPSVVAVPDLQGNAGLIGRSFSA